RTPYRYHTHTTTNLICNSDILYRDIDTVFARRATVLAPCAANTAAWLANTRGRSWNHWRACRVVVGMGGDRTGGDTEQRLRELVAGGKLETLATIKRDGWPQLTNVSYHYDRADHTIRVSVTDERAKTKNLRRDPRASFHVTGADGWSYVVAEGIATLSE